MKFEENFHVRDIETKKIKKKFRSITSAKRYLQSLNFGLRNYYEIFDNQEQEVIFKYIHYDRRSRIRL